MTPLVEVRSVSKAFRDYVAVDSVNLTIEPGEVVGLLGANGAGKTTLIKIIIGLLVPSSGSVSIFGSRPSRHSRRRLGYVPQNLGLYPDLTVSENIEFAARAFGSPPPPLDPSLQAVSDHLVGNLSLGFRKRVAFAAAMAHHPELLILDEPTSGVGPIGRADLWRTIAEASAQGTAILVSTHHMDEAEECDRLLMLSRGKVVREGRAQDIISAVKVVAVDTQDWRSALNAADQAGLRTSLVGTALRVVGSETSDVRDALSRSGLDFDLVEVEGTFDDAFSELAD